MHTIFRSKVSFTKREQDMFFDVVNVFAKSKEKGEAVFQLDSPPGSPITRYVVKVWRGYWENVAYLMHDSETGKVTVSFLIELNVDTALPIVKKTPTSTYSIVFKEGTVFDDDLLQNILQMIRARVHGGTTGLAEFFAIQEKITA